MSTQLKPTITPIKLMDYLHDSLMNVTSYFGGKLDEYNEIMSGKLLIDGDNSFNIEKEHVAFIEKTKTNGKYQKLLEFAKEYPNIPYHMRKQYLKRFFEINFL